MPETLCFSVLLGLHVLLVPRSTSLCGAARLRVILCIYLLPWGMFL